MSTRLTRGRGAGESGDGADSASAAHPRSASSSSAVSVLPSAPPVPGRWRALRRSASGAGSPSGPATIAYVLISAVLRGFAAALAGLFLVCGLALLDWAITPATGSNAGGLLRAGIVTFAAGHFLPVTIAGSAVTIRPLLVTLVAVLVIASSASRGRVVRGRTLEAAHGLALAVGYATAVQALVHYLGPADNVQLSAGPWWIAGIGVALGLATHRTAWNRWWRRAAPGYLRAGLRAGSVAVCLLLVAGGLALAAGLVLSFHDAVKVSELTAPDAGAAFGLTLLTVSIVPNAVIAGMGFVSGAGFTLGAGSYSPFGSAPTELPAIPLLTAAPDGVGSGRLGMLALAVPVLVGILLAWWIDRRLALRWQRMAAAGIASLFAGTVVAGLAMAASGGVSGGPWASSGVPPGLAALSVAGTVGVVSLAWTGAAGLRTVPWRAAGGADAAGEGEGRWDARSTDEDAGEGGEAGLAVSPSPTCAEAEEPAVEAEDAAGVDAGSVDDQQDSADPLARQEDSAVSSGPAGSSAAEAAEVTAAEVTAELEADESDESDQSDESDEDRPPVDRTPGVEADFPDDAPIARAGTDADTDTDERAEAGDDAGPGAGGAGAADSGVDRRAG